MLTHMRSRLNQYNDFEGPGEPLTGAAGSLMSSLGDVFSGVRGVPYRLAKSSNKRFERRKKRKASKKEQESRARAVDSGSASGKATRDPGSPSPPTQQTQATDHATNTQEALAPADEENAAQDAQGADEELHRVQTSTTDALHRTGTHQTASTAELNNPAEEFVSHVGRGAFKSASALARAPVDLSVALAQGFHNAPRLYGDDTVRRPPRVTGVRSGLRAARHEFVYGIYDGWTGLVRLPVRGVRNGGGVRGLVTGIGMGLTGFVLKDIAALVGPVGYTLKGLIKQAERRRQPTKYIRRARIIQGQRELRDLDEEQRKATAEKVARGWDVMRALWEALELEEKRKGGLVRRLGARRVRGVGAAFEGVTVAERALAAVRRGEGIESVVGKEAARKSHDEGRRAISVPERENGRKSKSNKGQGKPLVTDATGNDTEGRGEEPPDTVRSSDNNTAGQNDNKRAIIAAEEEGSDGIDETQAEAAQVNTPTEEKDNPFAASANDIVKNKAANKQTEARTMNGAVEHS